LQEIRALESKNRFLDAELGSKNEEVEELRLRLR